MDNADVEGGRDQEYQQGGRPKYNPVVPHDRAVLEMATMDSGSSSSSHGGSIRYSTFLFPCLRHFTCCVSTLETLFASSIMLLLLCQNTWRKVVVLEKFRGMAQVAESLKSDLKCTKDMNGQLLE